MISVEKAIRIITDGDAESLGKLLLEKKNKRISYAAYRTLLDLARASRSTECTAVLIEYGRARQFDQQEIERFESNGPEPEELFRYEKVCFDKDGDQIKGIEIKGLSTLGDLFVRKNSMNFNLKIPREINGIPVVCIGEKAFFRNNTIKDLQIHADLIRIGNQAFFHCAELKHILFFGRCEEIEDHAFYGSEKLLCADSIEHFHRIGMSAFADCRFLHSCNIVGPNLEIGTNAFSGCKGLSDDQRIMHIGNRVIGMIGQDRWAPLTIPKGWDIRDLFKRNDFDLIAPVPYLVVSDNDPKDVAHLPEWSALKKRDRFYMGRCLQQTHIAQNDPICWIVLENNERQVTAISEKALFSAPFEKTWDQRDLLKWLNAEVANSVFNQNELALCPELHLPGSIQLRGVVKERTDFCSRVFRYSPTNFSLSEDQAEEQYAEWVFDGLKMMERIPKGNAVAVRRDGVLCAVYGSNMLGVRPILTIRL